MSRSAAQPSVELHNMTKHGAAYGIAAYVWWGLSAAYFKWVAHVSALEVLAHRVIWSLPLLTAWLAATRGLGELKTVLKRRLAIATLGLTTILVATNWFTFIWAVGHGYVLQASLGYFINPLVSILLGLVFLGERLRRVQWCSVVLAATGVAYLTLSLGRIPMIALVLAISFGLFGLVRKRTSLDGLLSLTIETMLLLPVALSYLVYLGATSQLAFGSLSMRTDLLLPASGIVTALPLVWFGHAAQRMRLSTLGFLQYIAPSFHFVLAVVVYREPFGVRQLVAFACIWAALLIFSAEAAWLVQSRKPLARLGRSTSSHA